MQNGVKRKQRAKTKNNCIDTKKIINEKHWFILYYAGIRLHKLLILLNRCFADTEVWYPTYTIRKYNNRKLIYETRYIPFYPNYLFIYTNLEFVFSNKITDETARVRFIKSNNAYYYLDDEEIGIIKELEKELAVSKDIIEDECIFKEDDEVRIISGPFENCNGRILKISKEKVIVHIVIFGRETKFETEVKGIVKL